MLLTDTASIALFHLIVTLNWRLLEITKNYWRLLEITGDHATVRPDLAARCNSEQGLKDRYM